MLQLAIARRFGIYPRALPRRLKAETAALAMRAFAFAASDGRLDAD
ncbi:hypothetical protein [Bradyrhizobium sp. NAS80.1]|nr:hypothetical protein [Bradyrhizobium sp. NAS80.1]